MPAKGVTGDKIVTPRARLSFAHIFRPDTQGQYADGKYKCDLLFNETDDTEYQYGELKEKVKQGVTRLKRSALKTAREAFGKELKLSDITHPFRAGDEKDGQEAYEGMSFITARSKYKPDIADEKLNRIADEADLKSGDYVRVSLVPFTYVQGKKRGVSFRLGNIQRLAVGEALGGGSGGSAEADFDEVTVTASELDETAAFDDVTDDSDGDIGL